MNDSRSQLEFHLEDDASRIDATLAVVSSATLWATLLVMPMLMGGRHAWGHTVFFLLVAFGVTAESLRRDRRTTGSVVPRLTLACAVAGLLLAVFQFLPLPTEWLTWLSPALRQLLPSRLSAESSPALRWRTISLFPEASRHALALLVAVVGWGWLVAKKLERDWDPRRVLHAVAWSAVAIAGLGLAQYLLNNGRFLWWYEHPSRTTWYVVKGPFANENHFAHAMLIGLAAFGAIATGRRDSRSQTAVRIPFAVQDGLAGIVLVASIVLARSRAGWLLFSMAVCWVGLQSVTRFLSLRRRRPGACSSKFRFGGRWIAGLVVLGAFSGLGMSHVWQRGHGSDSRLQLSAVVGEARWSLWQADWSLLPRAGWWGMGGGIHRFVYQETFGGPLDVEFVYAENGYLQVALEYGLVGFAILLAGIGSVVVSTRHRVDFVASGPQHGCDASMSLAGNLVLAFVLLHGVVDFVWWIPACIAPAIAVWLSARAATHPSAPEPTKASGVTPLLPLIGRRLATVGLVFLVWWSVHQSLPRAWAAPAFDRYLRLERDMSIDDGARPEVLAQRIGLLEEIVQFDPGNVKACAWLAGLYLARFDDRRMERRNAMTVADLRHAARRADFTSRADLLGWLERACGEDVRDLLRAERLCLRAMSRQLVEAQHYLVAAQLAFLQPGSEEREEWLWRQAVRLQPRDAEILFLRGQELVLEGSDSKAWRHWRRASTESSEIAESIRRMVVPRIGVDQYIQAMRPTTRQVMELLRFCRREWPRGRDRSARWFVEYVARDIDRHEEVDREVIEEALDAGCLAGDWSRVLEFAQYQSERYPTDVRPRRKLAEAAIRLREWDIATREIRWLERFGGGRETTVRLWRLWRAEQVKQSPAVQRENVVNRVPAGDRVGSVEERR